MHCGFQTFPTGSVWGNKGYQWFKLTLMLWANAQSMFQSVISSDYSTCFNQLLVLLSLGIPTTWMYQNCKQIPATVLTYFCNDCWFLSCFLSFHMLSLNRLQTLRRSTVIYIAPSLSPPHNTYYFLRTHPIKMHYESSVSTHDNRLGQSLWLFFEPTKNPKICCYKPYVCNIHM